MRRCKLEVFIAGTPCCYQALKVVADVAGDRCDIIVYNLASGSSTRDGLERARQLKVSKVPSVALDGNLVDPADRNPVSAVILKSKITRKAA